MEKLAGCGCVTGLICILVGLCMYFSETIEEAYNIFLAPKTEVKVEYKNEFYRNYDFGFVQQMEDLVPHNRNELLNVYYTILNTGETEFSFYCPKDYENCIKDVKTLANDQNTLSDINNYVHPFNGFSHIETEYDTVGRVKVSIKHTYSDDEIYKIQAAVDKLFLTIYDPSLSELENVRRFHDYIINNSKYDIDKTTNGSTKYKSEIAYGPLFEGYAVCGGYTDLMELFLEKMNIKSYKISSEKHIWNGVELDGTWYHLDLTWDDPVASDGNDYLEHNYFLIDTKTLQGMEKTEHYFDEHHYLEFQSN